MREDGPAATLVHVGDVITHVSDTPVFNLQTAVAHINSANTPVTLILERPPTPVDESPELDREMLKDTDSIYTHQDNAIANLIASYHAARRSRLSATSILDNLFKVSSAIIKSRATSSANSPALISAVFYRLKRANIPLDERMYNVVMWSYISAGAASRALPLFDEIENPNVECYTTLIKAFSMLRRPDDAIALIPAMRRRSVKPNIRTYNALIASCVRGGKLEKARQLFSEMLVDDIQPNAVSWNIIINWHVQQKTGPKRLDGVLNAFADMKASGVSPNVITFTTIMKAYAKSGLLNKAEEVFTEMKMRLPGRVDTSVYNTLLTAYSSRLDWRRCMELLEEMKNYSTIPVFAESAPRSRLPTSRSFVQGRPWLGAEDNSSQPTPSSLRKSILQDDDNRCAPDSVSYSLVVKACASAGRPENARMVFDEMMESGFYPPAGQAVVSLMTGYAQAGLLSEGFNVLKNLKSWGVFPEVRMLTALMHGCLVAGEAGLALSVYAKLKSAKLEGDVVTYTLLLKAYGQLGELEKGLNVIKGMRGHGVKPNSVTYNALIECSVMYGRTDMALKGLDMILKERMVNRETFSALVGDGVGRTAEERLQFLMDVLRRVREGGSTPNGELYHALLEGCEKCGEWFLGGNLVREREDGGFVVGRRDRRYVRELEDQFRARQVVDPGF